MQVFWKTILIVCLVGVSIQFIQLERSNPPVNPSQTIHAVQHPDPSASAALARSCNDCHSNLTVWPWYSRIAPVSWLVVSDVRKGRADLNFSEWGAYPADKQKRMLAEICKQVSEKEMPESTYIWMHPEAKLSDADIHSICTWTQSLNPSPQQSAAQE